MDIPSKNCRVDHLSSLYQFRPVVDILRLDEVHPVVSGNKWFKLKEYLKDAEEQGKEHHGKENQEDVWLEEIGENEMLPGYQVEVRQEGCHHGHGKDH